MEGEIGLVHARPREKLGRRFLVGAFITVGAHSHTGRRGKGGEEKAHKGEGDCILDLPSFLGHTDIGVENFFWLYDQSHEVVDACAEAEKEAFVRVEFNVKVTAVSLYGAEEKLETAVVAWPAERTAFLASGDAFAGAQEQMQTIFTIADLSGSTRRIGRPFVSLFKMNCRDALPIGHAVRF